MGLFSRTPTNPSTGNKYMYSFSGADARVLVWFPQAPHLISELESVHTLSVSVHEAKGQARALGHRGVRGLSRGVRTIAGSLILTVINDNPMRSLHDQYRDAFINGGYKEPPQGWSLDRHRVGTGTLFDNYEYGNRLATLLPPFNMALQFVSETGPKFSAFSDADLSVVSEHPEGAGTMIVGMEFLDEGHVTSVQDIVTEITYSFIACDYKPLASFSIDSFAQPTDTDTVDLSDHDQLMRDLFWESTGVAGENNENLSSTERAVAAALGIQYADEERLAEILESVEPL